MLTVSLTHIMQIWRSCVQTKDTHKTMQIHIIGENTFSNGISLNNIRVHLQMTPTERKHTKEGSSDFIRSSSCCCDKS